MHTMNNSESAVNHASDNSNKHVFYEPIIIVAMAEAVWGWYPQTDTNDTNEDACTDVQRRLDSKIYFVWR